jgi:hypothetical protein
MPGQAVRRLCEDMRGPALPGGDGGGGLFEEWAMQAEALGTCLVFQRRVQVQAVWGGGT